MDLVVPDKSKSIQQGAIEPWTKAHYRSHLAGLKRAAKTSGIPLDVAWENLNDQEKQIIMDGDGGLRRHPRVLPVARAQEIQGARPGVPEPVPRVSDVPGLRRRRLRREARDVKIGGRTIDHVSSDTVREAEQFFKRAGADGEGTRPSATRCCAKFSSG